MTARSLTILALLSGCSLTGCTTTRTITSTCISERQYQQLKSAEPGKVHDKLTGRADEDVRPLAGNILELRSWGDTLLDTLRICAVPKK